MWTYKLNSVEKNYFKMVAEQKKILVNLSDGNKPLAKCKDYFSEEGRTDNVCLMKYWSAFA